MRTALSLLTGAVAFCCLGSGVASAQTCPTATPCNFTLTSTGINNIYDNIFTSPYGASINTVPTAVICDDFADDVFVGENWLVTSSTVANLASNVKWAGVANEQQLYNAAASLAETLNAGNTDVVSYAIWAVFDPTDVYSYLGAANPILGSVQSLVSAAETATYTPGEFADVSVYTAVPGSQIPVIDGPPQEFLVVHTPEPSSVSSLAGDFLGLAAFVAVFRRRIFSPAK